MTVFDDAMAEARASLEADDPEQLPAPQPLAAVPSPADDDAPPVASPNDPLPNARNFVAAHYRHPQHPLLVCHGGGFHAWDGRCWPDLEHAVLRRQLYEAFAGRVYVNGDGLLRPFMPNRRTIGDLVDALQAVTLLERSVTAPAWLGGDGPVPAAEVVAVANGLLHVPTRRLLAHSPRFFSPFSVPFAYDPAAPPPRRWLQFLADLWPHDQAAIECLQEEFGYHISGDTRLQKMFLKIGPRRSGKGTLARVLTALIGAHNVAGPTLAGLATNFGLQPLIGKAVAIVSDARIATGQAVVTERLLSISGEDLLTVDRKYAAPWTGRIGARFVILSNELPRLTDTSGALASRFVTLTLTRSFFGREDVHLTDALLQELPGILNWAFDGLDRLRARGRFDEPESSRAAVRDLEDLGSPTGAFLRDRCTVAAGESVPVDDLWRAWLTWCDRQGRDHPGTRQTFGRDLRAAVPGVALGRPRVGDGDRIRTYEGISLTPAHNGPVRGPTRTTTQNVPFDDPETEPVRSGPRTNLPSAWWDDAGSGPRSAPIFNAAAREAFDALADTPAQGDDDEAGAL